MGNIRAYSEKDTFITEKSLTANNGQNPVLEVWNKYDNIKGSKEWSRILIKFPLNEIKTKIDNGEAPDPRLDDTISIFMNMNSVLHGEEVASNYELWALPLTATWTEGKGLDSDSYFYEDQANALWATNSLLWEDYDGGASGGDVILGAHDKTWDIAGSQLFESGEENLRINITSYFNDYLDGLSADYGFMVRMSDAQEAKTVSDANDAGVNVSTITSDWYSKKFYGRETNTTNVPFVSMEWDSSVKDDRAMMPLSSTGSLFYYNFNRGQLKDLDGAKKFPGFVTLSADGNVITPANLTASRVSKGIYEVEVGTAHTDVIGESLTGINIGLSATSLFSDNWTISSSSEALVTSKIFNFEIEQPSEEASSYYEISRYPVKLPNLRDNYEKGNKHRIKVFIKDVSSNFSSVTGLSNSLNSFICTDGSFEIRERISDKIEIPEAKLSYDKNSNYFYLDTDNLYRGVDYKILFKLNIRGETFYYDEPEAWGFSVK